MIRHLKDISTTKLKRIVSFQTRSNGISQFSLYDLLTFFGAIKGSKTELLDESRNSPVAFVTTNVDVEKTLQANNYLDLNDYIEDVKKDRTRNDNLVNVVYRPFNLKIVFNFIEAFNKDVDKANEIKEQLTDSDFTYNLPYENTTITINMHFNSIKKIRKTKGENGMNMHYPYAEADVDMSINFWDVDQEQFFSSSKLTDTDRIKLERQNPDRLYTGPDGIYLLLGEFSTDKVIYDEGMRFVKNTYADSQLKMVFNLENKKINRNEDPISSIVQNEKILFTPGSRLTKDDLYGNTFFTPEDDLNDINKFLSYDYNEKESLFNKYLSDIKKENNSNSLTFNAIRKKRKTNGMFELLYRFFRRINNFRNYVETFDDNFKKVNKLNDEELKRIIQNPTNEKLKDALSKTPSESAKAAKQLILLNDDSNIWYRNNLYGTSKASLKSFTSSNGSFGKAESNNDIINNGLGISKGVYQGIARLINHTIEKVLEDDSSFENDDFLGNYKENIDIVRKEVSEENIQTYLNSLSKGRGEKLISHEEAEKEKEKRNAKPSQEQTEMKSGLDFYENEVDKTIRYVLKNDNDIYNLFKNKNKFDQPSLMNSIQKYIDANGKEIGKLEDDRHQYNANLKKLRDVYVDIKTKIEDLKEEKNSTDDKNKLAEINEELESLEKRKTANVKQINEIQTDYKKETRTREYNNLLKEKSILTNLQKEMESYFSDPDNIKMWRKLNDVVDKATGVESSAIRVILLHEGEGLNSKPEKEDEPKDKPHGATITPSENKITLGGNKYQINELPKEEEKKEDIKVEKISNSKPTPTQKETPVSKQSAPKTKSARVESTPTSTSQTKPAQESPEEKAKREKEERMERRLKEREERRKRLNEKNKYLFNLSKGLRKKIGH